ncbi:MAG: redoxin domain-containing protein, partial [Bacteroidales bacterium]|nr:redoxin domain-containing protein [Bacteroidales bacterium]
VRALTSGKLEFSFDANPDPEERTGKVTVKDKSGKVSPITLTFVQKEKMVVNIVGDVMEIPEEGGLFEVDIQYNTDFEVIIEEAAQSWVTFIVTRSLTSGKLQFQIAPNEISDIRTAVVDIADKTGRQRLGSLTLKQASKVRRLMMEFYYAMDGPNWTDNYNWGTDAPLERWCWVTYDYTRYGLRFGNTGLKGEIPEMIGDFGPALYSFMISGEPELTGSLPMSFAKLTELSWLTIANTSMTSLPDVFSGMKSLKEVFIAGNDKMTGPLPVSIGDSPELQSLKIFSNRLTGELPASWARLGKNLRLDDNCLTGKVPKTYMESEYSKDLLKEDILYQKPGYGIDVTDVEFYGYKFWPEQLYLPGETAVDLDGSILSFEDIISENKYTVYIFWATWCPFSKELMPQLRDYYENYQQDGLEVIATIVAGDSDGHEPTLSEYVNAVKERGYDKWYNFYFWQHEPRIYPAYVPIAEVYDSEGKILFSSFANYLDPVRKRFGRTASSELMPFLESLLGPATGPDVYTSTDYSKDGEVITLQRATVGKGIDIVFLGDGYVDKDMGSGGLYETVMRQAMEEYFAIEPYKTFRNRFNVYAVKAVSKNNRIGNDYTTALSSYHGYGSYMEGDIEKCYEYALKVPGITSKEGLLVSILVNSNKHGGTAHLDATLQSGVVFYPSFGNDPDVYGPTLRHESGGHGFAFLADEYNTYSSAATPEHIAYYNDVYNQYGWFANVDFTSDPAKIRWSAFLSDDRYKNEVGIFEGGALYSYGAYRPSRNSMMRDNLEYFNAPSRWAIYQQIMKRSGESYSFQTFLEYDAVNRGKASQAAARPPLKAAANGRKFEHTAPPVIKR